MMTTLKPEKEQNSAEAEYDTNPNEIDSECTSDYSGTMGKRLPLHNSQTNKLKVQTKLSFKYHFFLKKCDHKTNQRLRENVHNHGCKGFFVLRNQKDMMLLVS